MARPKRFYPAAFLMCGLLAIHSTMAQERVDVIRLSVVTVPSPVFEATLSPTGQWIACVLADGEIIISETKTGRLLTRIPKQDVSELSVCFNRTETWVATCCNRSTEVPKLPDPKRVGPPSPNETGRPMPASGGGEEHSARTIYFRNDRTPYMGPLVWPTEKVGIVKVWDLSNGRLLREHILPNPILSAHFDATHNELFVLSSDGTIARSPKNAEQALSKKRFELGLAEIANKFPIRQFSWSDNGDRLVTVWMGEGERLVAVKCLESNNLRSRRISSSQEKERPYVTAISPDGEFFATAGPGEKVFVWGFRADQPSRTLSSTTPGFLDPILVTFNSKSRRVLAVDRTGKFGVWSARSGFQIAWGQLESGGVRDAWFHDNSILIATGAFYRGGSKTEPLVIHSISLPNLIDSP